MAQKKVPQRKHPAKVKTSPEQELHRLRRHMRLLAEQWRGIAASRDLQGKTDGASSVLQALTGFMFQGLAESESRLPWRPLP